jgi:pyruvate dehydrogenase E1 component beta subunit
MPNILMPALSPTMEEGTLSKWLVKEGDTVNPGDVLAEIETDKATMEVESVDSGTVSKILVAEGTEGVKVNTPIVLVLAEGEEAPADAGGADAAAPKESEAPGPDAAAPTESQPTVKEVSAPAAPQFTAAADPDLPEGVEMAELTVRQALNEAMAEEMRRDKDVFIMGEEVAEYQGAYKVTQTCCRSSARARHRYADHRARLCRSRGRRRLCRAQARRRVHDLEFRHAGDRPDHQLRGQAALHVRRAGEGAHGVPRPQRRRRPRRRPAQPGLFRLVQPRSRPDGHRALFAADAKGLLKAAIRSPNPVIFLENEILYGSTGLKCPRSTTSCCRSARRALPARVQGRHHRFLLHGHALRHPGDREAGRRRRRRGADRPAHPAPARQRHGHRVGQEDRAPGDGGGGLAAGRHRRRDLGPPSWSRPSTISMPL